MLEIHPIADGNELQEYIERNGLPKNAAVLRAYEGGEVVGNIAVTIEGEAADSVLTMHKFEYADDFTGELLVRAAISYAFNRAVPKVTASLELRNEILDKVGFKTEGQNISIETKNVVHFCKK